MRAMCRLIGIYENKGCMEKVDMWKNKLHEADSEMSNYEWKHYALTRL